MFHTFCRMKGALITVCVVFFRIMRERKEKIKDFSLMCLSTQTQTQAQRENVMCNTPSL